MTQTWTECFAAVFVCLCVCNITTKCLEFISLSSLCWGILWHCSWVYKMQDKAQSVEILCLPLMTLKDQSVQVICVFFGAILFLICTSSLHVFSPPTPLFHPFFPTPLSSGLPPLLPLLLLLRLCLLRSTVQECRQRLHRSTSPWWWEKGRIFRRSLASGKQLTG